MIVRISLKKSATLSAAVFLSACGGSSSSTGPTFASIAEDFQGSLNAAGFATSLDFQDPSTFDLTSVDELPPPGSASYDGQIALTTATAIPPPEGSDAPPTFVDEETLLGNLEMEMDFTATGGTFSGAATGFLDMDNGSHSGTLELTDGDILQGADALTAERLERLGQAAPDPGDTSGVTNPNAAANGIVADFGGTLTAPNGTETDYDALALGIFTGPEANLAGTLQGSATDGTTDRVTTGFFVVTD